MSEISEFTFRETISISIHLKYTPHLPGFKSNLPVVPPKPRREIRASPNSCSLILQVAELMNLARDKEQRLIYSERERNEIERALRTAAAQIDLLQTEAANYTHELRLLTEALAYEKAVAAEVRDWLRVEIDV